MRLFMVADFSLEKLGSHSKNIEKTLGNLRNLEKSWNFVSLEKWKLDSSRMRQIQNYTLEWIVGYFLIFNRGFM